MGHTKPSRKLGEHHLLSLAKAMIHGLILTPFSFGGRKRTCLLALILLAAVVIVILIIAQSFRR